MAYKCMTYQCFECKRKGVKLWREYNTFLEDQVLTCVYCTMRSQGKTYHFNADGYHEYFKGDIMEGMRSCTIGWRIPACPTELPDARGKLPKGATYWGYTSVPDDKVNWWKGLPL